MKKFKVKHYELEIKSSVHEHSEEFNVIKESEIKAKYFIIENGMLIFKKSVNATDNIAAFQKFISVEEIKNE